MCLSLCPRFRFVNFFFQDEVIQGSMYEEIIDKLIDYGNQHLIQEVSERGRKRHRSALLYFFLFLEKKEPELIG